MLGLRQAREMTLIDEAVGTWGETTAALFFQQVFGSTGVCTHIVHAIGKHAHIHCLLLIETALGEKSAPFL